MNEIFTVSDTYLDGEVSWPVNPSFISRSWINNPEVKCTCFIQYGTSTIELNVTVLASI